MKFKTGLVVGAGIGFILGARAGRERYEQLRHLFDAVRGNPAVQQAAAAADRSTVKVRRAAGRGLVTASETIRRRADETRPASRP